MFSAKKLLLASKLHTATAAEGYVGHIKLVEKKVSPANEREKRSMIIMCSASPTPARKEKQILSLTFISNYHRE